ncbi:glycerophosphodiester phosphodiesterase [Jiangella alba]|uniref:Glycerophosphoryl diester phosphodiesterase n=1 Tax=Jiangella alba TaxID=561176 RepID=A0A1H5HKL5_9ACTN|nr:glycerophosphodiester phosphodiesterase family protein [Jiangella alba]SEE27788.1 Glycerophosphoryl diester phosphodiesterase [Jiangella alba]
MPSDQTFHHAPAVTRVGRRRVRRVTGVLVAMAVAFVGAAPAQAAEIVVVDTWDYPADLHDPATTSLGQTFDVPAGAAPVDTVGGVFATYGSTTSGVTLTLRAAGPGGAIVGTEVFVNLTDNAWVELTLDAPLEPGSYSLEATDPVGPVAWWSNTADLYAAGSAQLDGAAVAGDRTILVRKTMPAPPASAVVDIAHRGASGVAPENTVAAVERAVEQRAGFVEVDVQRTADGELVVLHDTMLARTTNAEAVFPDRAPWNVADFTLAEIRQLDAGSWFSADFAGEPIPTLREVVDALGPRTGLLLELKRPDLYPGIEAQIHAELSAVRGYLNRSLRTGRLVVQSFDAASMRTYHEVAPEVPIGLLYSSPPTHDELLAASVWVDQINMAFTVTDRRLVDRIHALGLTVSVWTLDTEQLMRQFLDLGVDGIITDHPDLLRDILNR